MMNYIEGGHESMADTDKKGGKAVKLSEIARKHSLADIYAFGSRAREIVAMMKKGKVLKHASSSDVDIGIRPKQSSRLSPRDLANITLELEDLFGVNRVDLVLLPGAEPFLAFDIIKGELLYTEDPLDQAHFELFVLRRAGDLLPFKKERIDMIFRGNAR
jgi:predicted nucleotidyltransferase